MAATTPQLPPPALPNPNLPTQPLTPLDKLDINGMYVMICLPAYWRLLLEGYAHIDPVTNQIIMDPAGGSGPRRPVSDDFVCQRVHEYRAQIERALTFDLYIHQGDSHGRVYRMRPRTAAGSTKITTTTTTMTTTTTTMTTATMQDGSDASASASAAPCVAAATRPSTSGYNPDADLDGRWRFDNYGARDVRTARGVVGLAKTAHVPFDAAADVHDWVLELDGWADDLDTGSYTLSLSEFTRRALEVQWRVCPVVPAMPAPAAVMAQVRSWALACVSRSVWSARPKPIVRVGGYTSAWAEMTAPRRTVRPGWVGGWPAVGIRG